MKYALIALLGLLSWTPVAAQEWQVARERFAFAGARLTIHIDADAAGALHLIRGAPGSVAVASRTAVGFTAAGLAESDELTLRAVGAGPVEYLVSVPEHVRVRVRLPGSTYGDAVGGHTRSRSFEWRRPARQEPTPAGSVPQWLPPLPTDSGSLFTTFVRGRAPAEVSLPDLSNVRSVSVRIEEGLFRANTSRPLSVTQGSEDRLEIRPAGPPMDIVLTVPSGTSSFRLVTGGGTALIVEGGSVTTLCSPFTEQWLSDGRRWVTFNPVNGTLQCTARPAPRHGGLARRHEG